MKRKSASFFWRGKLFPLLLLAALLTGCRSGVPDGVLRAGKMEDVLYDYHLAQAMAQQAPADSTAFYVETYRQAVFRKYGIDQAVFDRSMEWYLRHADRLAKIYARLTERFGNAGGGRGAVYAPGGDTLNIGGALPPFALLNAQGCNRFCFEAEPDSAPRRDDEVLWTFNTEWYYREGMRAACAVLVLRYEGDSLAVTQQDILSEGRQTVSLRVNSSRKLVGVSGFVYQKAEWSDRPRLLTLSSMRLLRVRRKDPPATENGADGTPVAESGDSTAVPRPLSRRQRLRDSLLRADTLNEQRPHFR